MGTHIDVKVMLKDREGQAFMGIGVVWLLEGIARHCSIREAARAMELSYPKALRILRNLEAGLGRPIVTRRKGGAERGGSALTAEGRDFLQRYTRLQARIKRFAERAYRQAFDGGPD